MTHDKKLEDEVNLIAKTKITTTEINKIISSLVKGVDLNTVKQSLLSHIEIVTNQRKLTFDIGKLMQTPKSVWGLFKNRIVESIEAKIPEMTQTSIELSNWSDYSSEGDVNVMSKKVMEALTRVRCLVHLTLDFSDVKVW
eukprot:TRINITY_DN2149_c1_g1_i7.p1 TRINITY_DN2149_c1_g1~~TRINITY_DN2149_c1_g1_i7.p1  ORF type:complete len:140 (-),score=16.31 TRINITY_DN2149_c1_g1_i7:124-543(-)